MTTPDTPSRAPAETPVTQEEMARITFRVGPRDFGDVVCETCGKLAIYMLARPYNLKRGGGIAKPSCAEHAMSYPQWVPGGVGNAMEDLVREMRNGGNGNV